IRKTVPRMSPLVAHRGRSRETIRPAPCTSGRSRDKRFAEGRVAEWFKATVLKTAPENTAQASYTAEAQHIRRRRWRVPAPFAKNIPAHRTAQWDWH
ncbi:MAG: hypothetical protein WC889_02685, partial [Myxococcota bacterium]